MWANKLRASSSMDSTTIQGTSMPAVEGIGPLEPDMGLAQQSSEGLGMLQRFHFITIYEKCVQISK